MPVNVSPWSIKIPENLLKDPQTRYYYQYLNDFLRQLYTRTGGATDLISTSSDELVSLRTLSGTSAGEDDLGSFTGTIIPDDSNIKESIQSLETSLDTANTNISTQTTRVDNLVTLSGVANNSTSLGTFTGATIADNSTVKTALQSLETSVETKQDLLVSGTNIKTVNSGSLLGSGNLSVGTVTSVSALTVGTTGTDVSSSVANSTSTPVITLNVPNASSVNRGALTAADWSTFNAKQDTLVSGTTLKTVNSSSLLGSGNLSVGTVTSIGLSTPTEITTASSPVTSSGTIALSWSSALANKFFAAPNGSSGTPSFRSIVAADIPTLNQNTTGSAGSVTSSLTMNNSGSGVASGTTFDGSTARTISYNTIGAQASLVSGTNIKTVNGVTLLGSGDLGTITAAYGGTGLTSYTAGDLSYYASGTALTKLAIGTSNYVLTSSGSAPQWTANTGTGNVVRASSPSFTTTIGVGGASASGSGAGISFPATQSASTDANTLDDYEEGTWTPTDGSGASLSLTVDYAKYTKIGNVVTLAASITYPSTASTAAVLISGIPFTVASQSAGTAKVWTNCGVDFTLFAYSYFGLFCRTNANADITNTQLGTKFINFTLQYIAA